MSASLADLGRREVNCMRGVGALALLTFLFAPWFSVGAGLQERLERPTGKDLLVAYLRPACESVYKGDFWNPRLRARRGTYALADAIHAQRTTVTQVTFLLGALFLTLVPHRVLERRGILGTTVLMSAIASFVTYGALEGWIYDTDFGETLRRRLFWAEISAYLSLIVGPLTCSIRSVPPKLKAGAVVLSAMPLSLAIRLAHVPRFDHGDTVVGVAWGGEVVATLGIILFLGLCSVLILPALTRPSAHPEREEDGGKRPVDVTVR